MGPAVVRAPAITRSSRKKPMCNTGVLVPKRKVPSRYTPVSILNAQAGTLNDP